MVAAAEIAVTGGGGEADDLTVNPRAARQRVLEARYRVAVPADELRMVSSATVGAVLEHMAAKHGITRVAGDEREVVGALVTRMLADLASTPLDLSGLSVDQFTDYLEKNLHSPEAVEVVMSRLTVRAITEYVVGQLAAAGRLAPGA